LSAEPCVLASCAKLPCLFSIRARQADGGQGMTRLEHSAYPDLRGRPLKRKEAYANHRLSPRNYLASQSCPLPRCSPPQCDDARAWYSQLPIATSAEAALAGNPLSLSPSLNAFTALHRHSRDWRIRSVTKHTTRLLPASLQNHNQGLPTASRQLYKHKCRSKFALVGR